MNFSEEEYLRFRDAKFASAPQSIEELIVEVKDPQNLAQSEMDALLSRIRKSNMAIYRSHVADPDLAKIALQFGLSGLDSNWLAGEDGISRIEVREEGKGYIPYTRKPIKWHTDGYYNPSARKIRSMLLHCVRSSREGGENHLMDHEILYCLLRDLDRHHVQALSMMDAMTIPERTDEAGVARAEETGPVFSFEEGHLHMRYTARTRSISWKEDAATQAAVAAIESLLSSPSPYIFHAKLEPGMGLLCNNVLHDRSAFNDDSRLLYRARYHDRIR
ncbi:MAG: taurine catabolism dioxygenase TauD [Burkholderiales bacterium]|nr:taurine catabolism dioxygenase TauD [Burkholderiales bacterium]